MNQVKKAVQIVEILYPRHKYTKLWLFDQSSNHKAMAPDALIARKNECHTRGQQPVIRDTVYKGVVQRMVYEDGTAKGLKRILDEWGIDTSKIKRDDMIAELDTHEDFAAEMSLVEHYITSRGHNILFFPKFHCEFNPIERVWGKAKQYARAYRNYSITGLRKTTVPTLEFVNLDLIRKYFRKARDYIRAYRDGNNAGRQVEDAAKRYKSHRRISKYVELLRVLCVW